MDTRQKQQVADFVEQQSEPLAARLTASSKTTNPEALQPVASGWLANQAAFLAGKPYRAGEWSARMLDYLHSVSGGLEEAFGLLLQFRNGLIEACLGKIEGVSDADIRDLVTQGADAHFQYLIEYYAQHIRDCDSAEQRKLKSLIEVVNHPLALLNGQGAIEAANREFGRRLNTTPDALVGHDFLALCDEKTANQIRNALRQKPSTQQVKPFAGELTRGKQSISVRIHAQPLFNTAGMRSGAVLGLDMKAAADKSAAANVRYIEEHLLSGLPLPIQMVDRDNNVTFSSDAIQALGVSGYGAREPLSTYLHRQRSGADIPDPCALVFETGQFHMEEIACNSGGVMRWYMLFLLPLSDVNGRVTHVITCIYDMTRRKQLHKQLEAQVIEQQRSSLATQVAVTVAHQLRNPLSVVLGFAEMMSKGLPPDQYSEAVSRILRNSMRCKDIVENLLDFGKGMPLERRPVDLEELMRKSVQPMLTPAQNRLIEWRFSDQPAQVECVPEQLTQVIMSLLKNALSAARERIVCAVVNKADLVRVRIVDDGPGIPLEQRERVFEPFHTTRRAEGAVGLGLSLARAVAVDYGGALSVSSPTGDEPDGACLILQLPKLKPVAKEEGGAETVDAPAGQTRKVLIIDDEADLLDLLKTALYMRGYVVDTAGTGLDALAKLKDNDYDAAVIDFQLSGTMSGCDVYDHIVKDHAQLADKVFFITADTMNYQTRLFLDETGRPVLEKPFLMTDFIAELEKLV